MISATGASRPTPGDLRAGFRQVPADHVLALGGLLLVVVALWTPLGLRVGPLFEEWISLYWTMERGTVPVQFPNRPLLLAPYALAHVTRHPLEAMNLMLAGAMLAKGALLYLLVVRLMPRSGALAFLSGALAIVYPADTGLFMLRTVSQHLAVALCLLAIHLLLSLWQRFGWWRLLAVWLVQALSLSLHAVSIPLFVASPALLVWQERKVTRRLLLTWGAAVVVPVAFGVVTLAYGLQRDTYEGQNLARSGLGPGVPAVALQLFRRTLAAGGRHFSGGWAEAFRGLLPAGSDTVLALAVVSLIVGPVLWRLARQDPGPRSWKEIRPYLELALVALCAIPVGFLLFLPTLWLQTSWRVFYLSSVAAAVVVAVLCTLIAAAAGRARRPVLVALGGLLVALGLVSGLAQHRRYGEWAQAQRRILLGIVRTAPQVKPGTTILLIDRPPYVGVRSWAVCGVVTDCVELTLRYVYGRRDLEAVFCAPGESPPRGTSEACRFERDGLVVEYLSPWGKPRRVVRRYAYDRLLAFDIREGSARLLTTLDQYAAAGSAAAYDPGPTIVEAPIPRLARVMLDP